MTGSVHGQFDYDEYKKKADTIRNTIWGWKMAPFEKRIAPDELKAAFTDNGITITKAPVITVDNTDAEHPIYKVVYTVFNGSAYRYCIDTYTKQ